MQPRHGFRHNYETDPNEPKHHYRVHKSGFGALVLFLDESVHRFIFGPYRCSKCTPGMVFGTVMKLTKMNQNINIGSKKEDWVRSFYFWPISVHRFFSAQLGALNATPSWFLTQLRN